MGVRPATDTGISHQVDPFDEGQRPRRTTHRDHGWGSSLLQPTQSEACSGQVTRAAHEAGGMGPGRQGGRARWEQA